MCVCVSVRSTRSGLQIDIFKNNNTLGLRLIFFNRVLGVHATCFAFLRSDVVAKHAYIRIAYFVI